MKKNFKLCLVMFLFLTGCSDRMDLEKTTISLAIALDITDDNEIIAYESNPIFGEEIEEKTDTLYAKASTLREGREKMNAEANGPVIGGKLQVVLVGKKLLEERELFPVLDILYRDAKNATNARLVAFEGSISDLMNTDISEKPILSVYLSNLIRHANERGFTSNTTLQDYHYQHFEKGITPYISELKKENDKIVVTGISLLNDKGHYIESLNRKESSLLQLIQKEVEFPLHIVLQIPEHLQISDNGMNQISFNITSVNQDIKSKYIDGKFVFNIQSKMKISITEMPFRVNMDKEKKKLEDIIAKAMKHEFTSLISKFQEHNIDPIGLGLVARAFHYPEWKEIQDKWGDTLANADIEFSTDVNIISYGILK